ARHGQATFLEEDYDRLSLLGETQARLLGEYWSRHGVTFDAVFTGPRVRQIRTAEIAAEAYADTSRESRTGSTSIISFPAAEVLDELDEYDMSSVMSKLLPVLIESDPTARTLSEEYERSRGTAGERKRFQFLFEVVMRAWIGGRIQPAGVESWHHFVLRVQRGIRKMLEGEGSGRRVVAFTSGGPVSVAMQMALGVSDQKTLELNWQIRNASLTEFMFSRNRFTLDTFNALPHLQGRETWSYR
ncbi:MAG: histidine phosphatase family protein, partial [Blastocatellia bacterium]